GRTPHFLATAACRFTFISFAQGFGDQPCIKTVSRRGYRFVVPVTRVGSAERVDGHTASGAPGPSSRIDAPERDRRRPPQIEHAVQQDRTLHRRVVTLVLGATIVAMAVGFTKLAMPLPQAHVIRYRQLTHNGRAIALGIQAPLLTDGSR